MSVFGSESVSSRYFRNLGLLGGGRTASVGTSESFTEDHHSMTRQELEYEPSEEEHEFNERVIATLKEKMVFGRGSANFGLKWECGTVDEADFVVGGWLSQVAPSRILANGQSLANGQTRFCVLEDSAKQFQQCLDATLKVRRAIPYEEMHCVRPRHISGAWYLQVFGRNTRWELMPINSADHELLHRWTCALQFRTETYDPSLSRHVVRANKAVLWTQSQYRMWRAKVKVQRKRERKNALVNRVATFFGWSNGDDDDEDEDEGFGMGEPAPGYVESVLEVASNLWGTVGSWLGLGGAIVEEDEEEDDHSLARLEKRISVSVQTKDDLPVLLEGQVEDEVWENQRWAPGAGWTNKTLGKTERCAFTDRLGRGNLPSPENIPLEAGWRKVSGNNANTGFDLDLSGVNRAQCDGEGYTYSFDWPLLDAELAKGNLVVHHGNKDFVRRRRWYRVRESVTSSSLLSTTRPILCQGWLGMKTSQGRWHSRQFCLVRPGLRVGELALRFPALVQFRVGFRDVAGVTKDGGTDGAQWRMLTDKSVSVLELTPKATLCDQTVATAKFPGHFNLVVDGMQRTFCALGSGDRQRWADAITYACKDAAKQARPRTMRLVGGAFETACYPTIIMDSLLVAPVDAVEEALFQSPSVAAAINVRMGHTNVVSQAWDVVTQAKTVTYRTKGDGLPVTEVWQRARTEPGQGFIVDRRIESPHAQFGDEFAIKLRFVLCKCEIQGEFGTRVICSVDVEYLKQTMMVGFIASEAKKNSTVALRDVWLPCVVAFLKTQGVLNEDSVKRLEVQRKITWGAQSQVGSKPGRVAGLPRDESERIEVGKW